MTTYHHHHYHPMMIIIYALFFFLSVISAFILTDVKDGSGSGSGEEFPEEYLSRTQNADLTLQWSNEAYAWLQKQLCDQQNFTSERTCVLMKEISKSDIRIYSVNAMPNTRYGVLFPDADGKQINAHDAILILDPFPNARFGHPLVVFYVEANVTPFKCRNTFNGILTASEHCLHVAYRNHCHNPPGGGSSAVSKPWGLWPAICKEHIFLPLVYPEDEAALQHNDRLRCYPNLGGFKRSCPALRPRSQTTHSYCNPLLTNINCFYSEDYFKSRCSPTHICDNVVLLSGGWSRQLSDLSSYSNLLNIKSMLMTHGFLEDNIKIFFANGFNDNDEDKQSRTRSYLATVKIAVRNYIKSMCDYEHCSDSLLIYLNNPSKADGTSLLWDSNADGMFDDMELYTTREFLRDISHCQANRVIVIADQSYAGSLVNAAEARFSALQNVVIFTSAEQFDWNSGHRDHLTNQFLRAKYTDTCLTDFKQFIRRSNNAPVFIGSKLGLLNSTLVGGPCTKEPSYLTDLNSSVYRGCQSVPII